jgi:hypothetical protein
MISPIDLYKGHLTILVIEKKQSIRLLELELDNARRQLRNLTRIQEEIENENQSEQLLHN